jgi:hypothetical protein
VFRPHPPVRSPPPRGRRADRAVPRLQPYPATTRRSTESTPAGSGANFLTGRSSFPNPISGPLSQGLSIAFAFATALCVIGAIVSVLTGRSGRGGRGSGDRRCGTGRRGR